MSPTCPPIPSRTCISAWRPSAIGTDATRKPLSLFDKAHATQSAWRTSRGETYDADNQSRFTDGMIAAFPCGSFDHARHSCDPAALPVFVVGLPRSGTTLLEQVLASHPAVWGAGELPLLHQVFRGLPQVIGRPQATPAEALANLSQSAAEVMARQYTDRLAALAPAAPPASSTRCMTTSGSSG